jgi:Fe-S cluster biosynthesis and repair protein YggX
VADVRSGLSITPPPEKEWLKKSTIICHSKRFSWLNAHNRLFLEKSIGDELVEKFGALYYGT